jgi:hypothetical protein
VALLWRARRRLADATAVQLTRYPDALARAVRDMECRDVAVEGGAAVSFLFPFWTRWTPDAPARDDAMAHVVGTQLELDKRLASLRRLGASADNQGGSAPPVARPNATSPRDVAAFVGWTILAVALIASCMVFNLMTTSLLLWGVWALLRLVFG